MSNPEIHTPAGAGVGRMTIARAAVEVCRKHGTDMVVYGDCGLLDEIGHLAQMKPTHPLNRHARILDALGRSPLWVERRGMWSTSNRIVRGFQIAPETVHV